MNSLRRIWGDGWWLSLKRGPTADLFDSDCLKSSNHNSFRSPKTSGIITKNLGWLSGNYVPSAKVWHLLVLSFIFSKVWRFHHPALQFLLVPQALGSWASFDCPVMNWGFHNWCLGCKLNQFSWEESTCSSLFAFGWTARWHWKLKAWKAVEVPMFRLHPCNQKENREFYFICH